MAPPRDDPFEYSPPPPAYSDQEFDQKVSRATDISLQTPSAPAPDLSEERWAEIEEAAFQAAIAASLAETIDDGNECGESSGSGSQHVEPGPPSPSSNLSTRPLRIEKRDKLSVDLKKGKEQPKWLPEAEVLSSSTEAGPSAAYPGAYYEDEAPPPFAETAPDNYFRRETAVIGYSPPDSAHTSPTLSSASPLLNLATLSVSETVSENASSIDTHPGHLLSSWEPQSTLPHDPPFGVHRQSLPASPSLPISSRTQQRPRSAISPSTGPTYMAQQNFYPQSPPAGLNSYNQPPITPQRPNSRPSATAHPVPHVQPSMGAPLMSFNASVAYGKSPFLRQQTPPPISSYQEPRQEVYRANAFYNAVVSAHLPSTPQRTTDQRTVYSSPYSSANSPQVSYRNAGGSSMNSNHSIQTIPYTPERNPWPQANYANNRPMSTYSMDTVYSNDGVSQAQYPNSFFQHPTPNWPPSTPERHFGNSYR